MIILITGTPGTGKTTVSNLLAKRLDYEILHICDLATDDVIEAVEGETKIIDVAKLEEKIKNQVSKDAVIDGHLSSHFSIGDLVIVLRTEPTTLKIRLKEKGFDEKKTKENLEAEALDACLIDSMENHENVFEIDTTDKEPENVLLDILKIIYGEGDDFRPGKIDWSEMVF